MTLAQLNRKNGIDLDALYPTRSQEPRRKAVYLEGYPDRISHCVPDKGAAGHPKRAAALAAARALLMAIGGTCAVAYLAAMPWWITIGGGGLVVVAWFALYRAILNWRNR